MKAETTTLGAAALAVWLSACAGAPEPSPVTPPGTAAPASAAASANPTPASASEFEALFRARLDSARTRFTPADVQFMNGMIHHHAQALVMSALVPERSATASVRTLASRIINAQRDEIAVMQEWLRDRGQSVPELHGEGAGLMVHGEGGHGGHHMPGMLTADQLKELEQARGVSFDRLFLRYMIQHHRGAVTMVRELFATDGAGQDEAVFKFASDVQVDQTTEIDRMEKMLAALSASGTPR